MAGDNFLKMGHSNLLWDFIFLVKLSLTNGVLVLDAITIAI